MSRSVFIIVFDFMLCLTNNKNIFHKNDSIHESKAQEIIK